MAPLRGRISGLVGGLALAGAACGDALVDDAYVGRPRYEVRGNVVSTSSEVNASQPLVELALFWSPRGLGNGDAWVQQPGGAGRAEYFRDFQLSVYDEPEPSSLVTTPSGARYGIAMLAVYRDANGNGRRDGSEPFLGSAHQAAVLRVPVPLSAEDSPTGARLSAGWHVVSIPLTCNPLRPPTAPPLESSPEADGDCGVPLGAECRTDADCAGGLCLKQAAGPWPGGACVIPEPPPKGCRQRGSVLMRLEGNPSQTVTRLWIQACQENADCGRSGYQCDQQLRGCRPSLVIPVELDDGRSPPPLFCRKE